MAFEATLSPGQEYFILLDDVSVRNGACLPTGSCDFESGLCTWVNSDLNNHDWVQADGHGGGPLIDHTTNTADGKDKKKNYRSLGVAIFFSSTEKLRKPLT